MVENKSYNNVTNFLCRLGEYHDQVHSVSVGDIFQINLQKMQKLPLMHINPTNVTTVDIATDIIGMLRHSSRQSLAGTNDINFPKYFTTGQFTIEPFQERFDNLLCGWSFSVGIQVIDDFQTCNIPVTDLGAGY
jgi:hypothetical protein